MTLSLTLEQVEALPPCKERLPVIRKLLTPGRAYTAREAHAAGVKLADLLWVAGELSRTDADMPRRLRHFAADCAEHVLPFFERAYPDDMRPRNAITAARLYADGEIRKSDLAAAWDAAGAAWNAARATARAARNAAWAAWAAGAAWAAAWDAAGAVAVSAWDAAWAAAAAEDAERKWQLERLFHWMEVDLAAPVGKGGRC